MTFDPMAFWKRDAVYIVLCVFALLACVYTLSQAGKYSQACNDHWEKQVERLCTSIQDAPVSAYIPFNQTFKLGGDYASTNLTDNP